MKKIFLNEISLIELEEFFRNILRTESLNNNRPSQSISDELLTRKELAKFLRISLPTVSRLCTEKKIKPIYCGHKQMFSKRKVLESLEDINKHHYSRRVK